MSADFRAALVVSTVMVALLAAAALAARSAEVTLRVERFYDPGNFIWRLRFSGAASPARAGEYVAVLGHTCGRPASSAVSVAGDTTRADGSWGPVVPGTQGVPDVAVLPPATYRARWNGLWSEPVTLRIPLPVSVFKVPSERRWRVSVSVQDPRRYAGREVHLQRLARGGWTLVRRARLTRLRGSPWALGASFAVQARGLTLRALVPASAAGPCYLEGASKPWRS